jgi:hypothetical protein
MVARLTREGPVPQTGDLRAAARQQCSLREGLRVRYFYSEQTLMRSPCIALACWLAVVGCSQATGSPSAEPSSAPVDAGDADADTAGDPNPSSDDRHFAPEGLLIEEEAGAEGGLTLIAATLRDTTSGVQLLVAVSNEGTTPACQAGITADLFDLPGQLVGNVSAPLLGGRPYRLDAEVILACIGPGEVAMAATTESSETPSLAELSRIVHRFPAFTVTVAPLAGQLEVNDLQLVVEGSEASYRGEVTNGFAVPVLNPSVAVFAVNRVGRPLSMAAGSATLQLEVGGRWSFRTDPLSEQGDDAVAFATGSLVYPQP